jgi:hypothetical protein
MRTDKVLWWFALGCAVFLLLGPLGGRTRWHNPGGGTITDAAGWDWAVLIAGCAAIAGLVVGRLARPRVVVPVTAAGVAIAAFGMAAAVTGQYWMAILQGNIQPRGFDPHRDDPFRVIVTSGLQPFAVVATVATGLALVLAVSWRWPGERA